MQLSETYAVGKCKKDEKINSVPYFYEKDKKFEDVRERVGISISNTVAATDASGHWGRWQG